jgi:two-component system CheB/CheR fusion protein
VTGVESGGVEARSRCPIVGVGASAGGLAAFEAFFQGVPAGTVPAMAFVLVQHLAADRASRLAEIVAGFTHLEVRELQHGTMPEPGRVYVLPPGREVVLRGGRLLLLEPVAPRGRRLPIDLFFRSLAGELADQAVGVVLSGTGQDGTQGIRSLHAAGGLCLAQNPASAEHDDMPRSALATGCIESPLPPAEMFVVIREHLERAASSPRPTPVAPPAGDPMQQILGLLRAQTGRDFSLYKPSTIGRRIERRMASRGLATLEAYAEHLSTDPNEIALLFHDLLIGVTSFFRDREAFAALAEQVIPAIFEGKEDGASVRVWSAGCSTGEEAYSLAMLLREHMDTLETRHRVQVFATDIDDHAIAAARAGIYPSEIAVDLSRERLDRFFTAAADGSSYRIQKEIREMLVFSEHDLVNDPPFSRLDLVVCRNLLIYMSTALQKKLVPLFHYALVPGGFLFLGSSESVGESNDRFSVLDRSWKIYQRRELAAGTTRAPLGRVLSLSTQASMLAEPADKRAPTRREITERILLATSPAAALVDARGDVLYFHGRTGLFLEPAPGETRETNLLSMAREGLRADLAVALGQAQRTGAPTTARGVRVRTNGHFTLVDLAVHPVGGEGPPLYVVSLDGGEPITEPTEPSSPEEPSSVVAALRRELAARDEYLRTTREALESANRDLTVANEEMQSVNEELQSTNEELETSKEELQSVNEELSTVNAELQSKIADLSRANNDLNNLLAGTGIGTLFLDRTLRILSFTPAATKIIHLLLSDVGRPVAHLVTNLVRYDTFVADAAAVLETLAPYEREVETKDARWYAMRILPYRTLENVVDGVVITFVDITEVVDARTVIERVRANQTVRGPT